MIVDTTKLLSLTQAAAKTGYMSEAVLRGRVRGGHLEVIRIGTALYVTEDALEAFLKREGIVGY